MVLMAPDIQENNVIENHQILSQEEMKQYFGLYQGSGGYISGTSEIVFSGANNVPNTLKHSIELAAKNNIFHLDRDNSLANKVNNICTTFNLTKTELTQVCKVQSRKTLYNWMDGTSTPRKSAMSRIFDLSVIAQAWEQSGFSINNEQVNTPILDDKSILNLLTDEKLDKELILFAGTRLNLSSLPDKKFEDPFSI